MKVNIRGVWYDGDIEPIHLKLSETDKNNIKKMNERENIINFPAGMSLEGAKKILKIE